MGVLNELREELDRARDRIAELETSLDSVTQTHLEEQQRWGIERERLTRHHAKEIEGYKESLDFWIKEAREWSIKFGNYRQRVEFYSRKLDVWVDGMKNYGKAGVLLDMLFLITCLVYVWRSGAPLWPF